MPPAPAGAATAPWAAGYRGRQPPERPTLISRPADVPRRSPASHRVPEDPGRRGNHGATAWPGQERAVVGKGRPAGQRRREQDRQCGVNDADDERPGMTDGSGARPAGPPSGPPGRGRHTRKRGRAIRPGTALHHVPRPTHL